MAPPRRALIAITSAHAPLYPEGKETGLFITEALHPFDVFKEAGFDVDLVSETGTYTPDWLSQQKDWLKPKEKKIWEDHSSEFRSKLDRLLKPSDVKWEDYGIFFASAGHASLIDYPDAKGEFTFIMVLFIHVIDNVQAFKRSLPTCTVAATSFQLSATAALSFLA
jgi:putative intracellular protease/amidase